MSPASSYEISSDLIISSWNLLTNPDTLVQSCQSNAVVDSKKTKGQVIADFHVKSAGRSEAVLTNAENSRASSNVGGQSAALTATCSSDHLDTEHSKYDTGDKITRQTRPSKSKKLETVNSVALPYEDQMCNTDFNVKGDLVRHTKTHGTKRSFQCNACGYECVGASHLERHTRTHTGERPFRCDVCEKTFTQKSCLTEHKKIHADEHPFKCEVCECELASAGSLKRHKMTHTGERPFQCDECGKRRIQLRSATLPLRSLNQFSKDGLRLLEAKAFPRSQVQPPFYPGYKLIADRSHIGSLRDVLPEQPVKVLIQPALPR